MNKENQALLSPEVAKHFEVTEDLTGGGSLQVFPGFGPINLKTMTLEDASSLVGREFKWLKQTSDADALAKAIAAEKLIAEAPAETAPEAPKSKGK